MIKFDLDEDKIDERGLTQKGQDFWDSFKYLLLFFVGAGTAVGIIKISEVLAQ